MIVRRLLSYLKPVWFRLTVALLCMTGVAAITTGTVWLQKFLFDQALGQKDIVSLQTGVLLLVSAIALKSILWYSHTYLAQYVSHSAARQIRDDAYRHLYSLSMGFFDQKASGGLLARLTNDITILQSTLTSAPTVI